MAKALGIDFAPAVLGFTRPGGGSGGGFGGGGGGGGFARPEVDGLVVASQHKAVLCDAYAGWAADQVERQALKRSRLVLNKWASLVRNALTRCRLQEEYGKF